MAQSGVLPASSRAAARSARAGHFRQQDGIGAGGGADIFRAGLAAGGVDPHDRGTRAESAWRRPLHARHARRCLGARPTASSRSRMIASQDSVRALLDRPQHCCPGTKSVARKRGLLSAFDQHELRHR